MSDFKAKMHQIRFWLEINVKEIQQTTLSEILRKRLGVKWYISVEL